MSDFSTDSVLLDHRCQDTVGDGVRIARRGLLRLSAATVAAALVSSCAAGSRVGKAALAAPDGVSGDEPVGSRPLDGGALDAAEFLSEFHPRALEFIEAGGSREEGYLLTVRELLLRLQVPSQTDARSAAAAFHKDNRARGGGREIGFVMFEFDPGRGFAHHDHRDYNGVILGVEGEAQVANFDILGDTPVPPEGTTFQIRQTRDDLILPGRFSTLETRRDNIHDLKAGPEGAVVLDVFTYLKPGARSYFLEVEPEARDAERRIFDAAWA